MLADFAKAAMQGILAGCGANACIQFPVLAEHSFDIAEAMLSEMMTRTQSGDNAQQLITK